MSDLKVKVNSLWDGSCNFCNKGKLTSSGRGLKYPYKEVIKIYGKCITVNICKECYEELVHDVKELKLSE